MSIALVHYLHPQSSAIKNISPSVDYLTLTINDTLIKVEAIQIEGHRRNTKSGEPDAHNWPASKEEVQ
jgi:hypothetical protein